MLIIFFSNNKMAKISSSSLPYRQLRKEITSFMVSETMFTAVQAA